ncbi:MAG: hypothetical protein OEY96_14040, partial [Gammaproteobacteria bacterium]|nr:hypothetical protein [Gammaproteobacteria bacterium]
FWYLHQNQEAIKQSILDYFLPTLWQDISEFLVEFFYESQAQMVIANAILSGSLVLSSVFLFPIKEKFSAIFEKDYCQIAGKSERESQEFPLLYQGLEELKLLVIYITAQGIILWIGFYPYVWAEWLSILLSYFFLFFTFSLDFISPTLQRHRKKYSFIIKLLTINFWQTLLFGFIFSLPVILLGQLVFSFENLTLIEVSAILFLVNIFLFSIAVSSGTVIASDLLDSSEQVKEPSSNKKTTGYAILITTFLVVITFHWFLLKSLHHKSQILKASYEVDWDSIDYQLPSLNKLLSGKVDSRFSINVDIFNPTPHDIVIENSTIYITQFNQSIAEVKIDGFNVYSGEKRPVKLNFDSISTLNNASKISDLLEGWQVEMHVELMPYIPLIVRFTD